MTILRGGLARCPAKACPVRYSTGGGRYCQEHGAGDDGDAMARLAELAGTAPSDRITDADGTASRDRN